VAKKNSLERPKPWKKLREEPGYEGWPVPFWLYRVEIITEHGQVVQMFINDQHGQIIIITVGMVLGLRSSEREKEREEKRIRESTLKFTQDTG
jgi:hypothetical protein